MSVFRCLDRRALRRTIITIGASSAIRAAETGTADIFKDSLHEMATAGTVIAAFVFGKRLRPFRPWKNCAHCPCLNPVVHGKPRRAVIHVPGNRQRRGGGDSRAAGGGGASLYGDLLVPLRRRSAVIVLKL